MIYISSHILFLVLVLGNFPILVLGLHERPRTTCGMPSMGVFLRDPSPYLRQFRRKPRKALNG